MRPPPSERAQRALALVQDLQGRLIRRLEAAALSLGRQEAFEPVQWLRDEGVHGGGERWVIGDTRTYNRASANVSAVHYDDLPDKKLGSATALSCIVHPANPHAPSMHMHMSWTEMKDGSGTWRLMVDLNPSIPNNRHTAAFTQMLRTAIPDHYEEGTDQGNTYFHIPALDRHRGVTHFYLEGFTSGDWEADARLVRHLTDTVIDTYGSLVENGSRVNVTPIQRRQQLAYHTLYLFQVLTLDRGTTSGLLVHDQNDAGVMGSLPAAVDRALLASWAEKVPEVQKSLVAALVQALPDKNPSPVTHDVKLRLAAAVRAHYLAHPEALALQARGHTLPPTVANHR